METHTLCRHFSILTKTFFFTLPDFQKDSVELSFKRHKVTVEMAEYTGVAILKAHIVDWRIKRISEHYEKDLKYIWCLLLCKPCISFRNWILILVTILAYPHAPEKRLICCHSYRLPGVSWGNRFVGVGSAYECPKLQDLVIWQERKKGI